MAGTTRLELATSAVTARTYGCLKEQKSGSRNRRELLLFPRCSRIRTSEIPNQIADGLAPTFYGSESRALQIENNTERNLKDLEELLRSVKTLKRNNEESSGILVGSSMAPRFFLSE
jgi:hypothetical protein